MPEQLHLAANLAQNSLVFGHLQIVYEDPAGLLYEAESTSPGFPYFWGDWVYPAFGRRHDDQGNTPGFGDPSNYASVALNLLPEQQAKYVWELIGQVHTSLSTGGHGIDYDADQNSNSYATTVLSVVGINIAPYLDAATPSSVDSFPGVGRNILDGAKTGGLFSGHDTAIPLTLAGTRGQDYIMTGIGDDTLAGRSGQDTIISGGGDDFVRGGGGNDSIEGGAGDDLLRGNAGNDTILGGAGNDMLTGSNGDDLLLGGEGDDRLVGHRNNDTLEGGAGSDRIEGRSGNDILSGGADADMFYFSSGRDQILDFEDDIDLILILAKRVGGATTGQEIVDSFGSLLDDGALLDFGRHELLINGVSDLQTLVDDLLLY
jgi:Ca2+-binding RTX toxin-like protein